MKGQLLPHLYEAVAQGAMFGIVVFESGTGECLFINHMAIELLGTETPRIHNLIPSVDRPPFTSFSASLLDYDGLYHDVVINSGTLPGHSFIGNLGVRRLEVDGISAQLVMMQDVTVQKKLQRDIMAKQTEIKATFEELRKQNHQLRQLDVAKDKFIALTTHELRTPLAAMVASAEILKLGLYDDALQMKEFIDMIYEQGQHLQTLVNDILDFAKIQAGKMDFYLEKADPAAIAQVVLRSFEGMAEGARVILSLDAPAVPKLCYFDELRLRQVISNIVNNGIKYNRPHGLVRVYLTEDEEFVSLHVQDTGIGIPPGEIEKVFNEFETVGQVDEHHKGTGLGMPISRKLAEGMGGRLTVISADGKGSTFTVILPKGRVLEDELYRPRPEKAGDLAA